MGFPIDMNALKGIESSKDLIFNHGIKIAISAWLENEVKRSGRPLEVISAGLEVGDVIETEGIKYVVVHKEGHTVCIDFYVEPKPVVVNNRKPYYRMNQRWA